MSLLFSLINLLLLFGSTFCQGWVRQDLDPDLYPLAKCNDGSQANYFIHNQPVTGKIYINLEGGGKCDNVQDCHNRCEKTPTRCTAINEHRTLPSDEMDDPFIREAGDPFSGYWNDHKDDRFIREARDPFSGYWKVYIHYCSSDTWAGTRQASQQTGGYNFYGKHIFDSVVQDLSKNFGLLNASDVILTGSSAGAQGVMYRCDDFASVVMSANPEANVRCIANAPEYYPPDVYTPDCHTRAPDYQNELAVFWSSVRDASCLADNVDSDNVGEMCGVTSRFAQYVTTPLMILSSHWDIVFPGEFGCAPKPDSGGDYEEFKIQWMLAHHQEVETLMEEQPQIAFFSPNCRVHGMVGNQKITVVENETGELTHIGDFITKWLAGEGRRPQHANDDPTVVNPSCEEE